MPKPIIAKANRVPLVLPLPTSLKFQPVDEGEVAARLVQAALAKPGFRLPDLSGPEVLTLGDAARQWKAVRRSWKPVVPIPLFGETAAAFRAGRNTTREGVHGTIRWRDWLAARDAARHL